MKIPDKIVNFLKRQGVVIVSTIDSLGNIHSSAKSAVGVDRDGKIFIADLYAGTTLRNLKADSRITLTSVDEDSFEGYAIQGMAKVLSREDLDGKMISEWEDKLVQRISNRMIKGVQTGVRSKKPYEAELPQRVEHIIEIDIKNSIDISPPKKVIVEK